MGRRGGCTASSAPLRTPGEQGRALDQLVPRHRIQAALRHATAAVARSADPLQECRDAARRSDLADHLDRPDVDTELE